MTTRRHHMPYGAELTEDGSVRFRLWAPGARQIDLCLQREDGERLIAMSHRDAGWYELVTREAGASDRYRFRIDGDMRVPDPASRFQPEDVHGPSEIVDPAAFDWHDEDWRGRPWEETVLYEVHVGTFTPEGSFRAIEERLDYLADLGVTAIELMPVADFPGRRNWGYDGVLPYAPDGSYGRPEDLKHLVQCAHQRGLMVFLDVVYNHFGPEGNYLHVYAEPFFTERHHTPWGAGINFDGSGSRDVRDFFIHNALYWLEEYHLDGLRLDAVHAIADDSQPDILQELAVRVHAGPGRNRHVHLVLENDHNAARYLVRSEDGSPRLYVAQWNDDAHHALHLLATGESDGYYEDYADAPTDHLGRTLTEGFAYQGDPSAYRHGERRGELSSHLPLTAFVNLLQNHDQVGNRALGERIDRLTSREALRAVTAILLLAPSPPLLFMGQEFLAPDPFLFFCDFGDDLAQAVTQGRRREFARFERFSNPEAQQAIPDPNDPATFERSRLDWGNLDKEPHRGWLALHRELLALRQREIIPRLAQLRGGEASYETLGESGVL
ncbi:MAG: malto-oligosyltrehalose trehalohydrolase, partial [Chromatiaceae bacterium]